MTADVELLPLPEKEQLANPCAHVFGSVTAYGHTDETLTAYARACVAHATAALQAETEALRAERDALREEVERLRSDRDSWEQQASDRVADWYAEHLRTERLAEALREMRKYVTAALQAQREAFAGYEHCSDIPGIEADLHKIDTLLREQEEGHG